jgi:hypothetical protein
MAKLVVIRFGYNILVGISATLVGIAFITIVISGAMDFFKPPFFVKVVFFVSGILIGFLGIFGIFYGPKLSRKLIKLSKKIRIEDDKVIFPREMKLRPGILEVEYRIGSNFRYWTTFEDVGDELIAREIDIKSFKGVISALAGFDSAKLKIGAKLIASSATLEWIKLPAYEIIDKENNVPMASVILAVIPPSNLSFTIGKTTLMVSDGADMGLAEVKVSNDCLEGILSYQKSLKGKSRELRLEFLFETQMAIYRIVIARIKKSGSKKFKFKLNPVSKVIYVLTTDQNLSPRKIIKNIGLETPFIAGEAWRRGKAKLILILDLPAAKDIVDETSINVGELSNW